MGTRALKYKIQTTCNKYLSRIKPYQFDCGRYNGTFLSEPCADDSGCSVLNDAQEIVYGFWGDSNEITPNRLESLEVIRQNIGVEFVFVTPENLAQYILADHPLHEAYPYLSSVHKSDYLRCYFMHHYGGGYTDIKQQTHSWKDLFAELNATECYVYGYPELSARGVAPAGGVIEKDMKRHWRYLIGNGAYICRPRSPFTTMWYAELLRRMDYFSEALKQNPGNAYGNNEGYPIPWTHILGNIFHPLCLRYNEKIMSCEKLKPVLKNYR